MNILWLATYLYAMKINCLLLTFRRPVYIQIFTFFLSRDYPCKYAYSFYSCRISGDNKQRPRRAVEAHQRWRWTHSRNGFQ